MKQTKQTSNLSSPGLPGQGAAKILALVVCCLTIVQPRVSLAFEPAAMPAKVPVENSEAPATIDDGNSAKLSPNEMRVVPEMGIHYSEYSKALRDPSEYRANRKLRPKEMAILLQNEYGQGSVIGRTAGLVAQAFATVEAGAQIPLDSVNLAAEEAVVRARRYRALRHLPHVRLRSEVDIDEIRVGFKTTW